MVYDGLDHVSFQAAGGSLPLAGSWTLGSFAERLSELDAFPDPPVRDVVARATGTGPSSRPRSTWRCGRQGRSLPSSVGRELRPLTLRRVDAPGRDRTPTSPRPPSACCACSSATRRTRFKLDPTNTWSDGLIEELAATGAVDSLDLKGQYKGTPVDVETDPELYAQAGRGVPGRLARGPGPQRRDAARARAAPRPHHLGRADPLGRRHPRARMGAAHGEHQALAGRLAGGARPRLRLLRRARHRRLRRRARPSSALAATTSSTSPRCSTRTRPTTWRRAASTPRAAGRACPRARSSSSPPPPASASPVIEASPAAPRAARRRSSWPSAWPRSWARRAASLDLALYDVRLPGEPGDVVAGALRDGGRARRGGADRLQRRPRRARLPAAAAHRAGADRGARRSPPAASRASPT